MGSVSVYILFLGLTAKWTSGQFLNNRPYPTYSLENMPDTGFSCRDKILGGYYADPETQCQMFHICVKVSGVGVQDFRFLCPNGTAFDQDHQICADWDDVDCDATTLYYASDNFDLYRLGSGFESKARKYGEDEETFALQRAETGDARLNREHQSQRVNQQKDNNNGFTRKVNNNNNYQQNNQNNNRQSSNANAERDIFKGSSSSNFFNNRNGGKENDDEYDDNVNYNQNSDYEQKRKLNRGQARRPVNNNQQQQQKPAQQPAKQDETLTTIPQKPTGFRNNFAGSSYVPTTLRSTAAPQESTTNANVPQQRTRGSQRGRVVNNDRQYSNADNFRQNNGGNNNNRQNQNYQSQTQQQQQQQYTVSTPAPFRQTKLYTKYDDGQYRPSTPAPTPTLEPENYPSNFPTKLTKATPFQTKQTESYQTTPVNRNTAFSNQYDVPKVKQTTQKDYSSSQGSSTTQFNNFDSTKKQTAATNQQSSSQYNTYETKKITTPFKTSYSSTNNQNTFETKKVTTPFNKGENYPTTYSPKTKFNQQQFNNQKTPEAFPTTFAPRTNAAYSQISQQSTQFNNNNNNNNKVSSQNTQNYNTPTTQRYISQSTQFNGQNNQQYNAQQNNNNGQYNNQNSRQLSNQNGQYNQQTQKNNGQYNQQNNGQYTQQQNNQRQSTQNFNSQLFDTSKSTNAQSTYSTQYTPTVPKITTPYTPSTTPYPNRASRYDETQYDDGSYNSKYDNYDRKNDDEFLKTAHSQNIANSRNEYLQSQKSVPSTTQKPRPFSASVNTPKTNDFPVSKPVQNTKPAPQNNQQTQANNKPQAPKGTPGKNEKNASYDYAYYDTNVGSEAEYDIGTDFEKSEVKKL